MSHDNELKNLSEPDLLARCIWGEARGEMVEGKLAVAHVVLNRVKARSWYGKSISDVILKPRQFSCFDEDDPNLGQILKLSSNSPELAFCRAIAELTIRDRLTNDPTGGATHYHTVNSKPSWASKLVFLCRIGNHLFYKESRYRMLNKLSSWMKQLSPRPSPANVPHSAERMEHSAKDEVSCSMRHALCSMQEEE